MSVSVGGHHFKDTIVNGEKGHVEGPSTEVKHKDILLSLALVQTIGNGSSSPGQTENQKT